MTFCLRLLNQKRGESTSKILSLAVFLCLLDRVIIVTLSANELHFSLKIILILHKLVPNWHNYHR